MASRRTAQGMRWDINLGQVAQLIGTVYGMDKAVKTNVYIDSLMRAAHAEAASQFDKDIAAQAAATQMFNHMYEWGTAGINKGDSSHNLSPLSDAAKLWKHRITGRGKHKGIDFSFRASKFPVPQPTPDKTLVDQEHLDKLSGRKHIFYWKAPIIEYGMKVKLRPKYAKAIFVPFYGKPRSPHLTDRQREQGFLFHKGPLTNVPGHGTIQGRDLAGNFTAFWESWWNSTGNIILNESMGREVNKHTREALAASGKVGKRSRSKEWKFEILTAEKETQRFMQARAKAEQIRERMESEVW